MAVVNVTKNNYTVDSLCQWDVNQTLQVYGLSLSTIPEVHFANEAMGRAIVRQATMDSAGVVSVDIPNSLLQKPYTISAYICTYEGDTFRSLYKIDIPVKARTQPADYTLVDDPEVYSFNALENKVENAIALCETTAKAMAEATANSTAAYANAQKELVDAKQFYTDSVNSAVDKIIEDTDTYVRDEILDSETSALCGMADGALPTDVFKKLLYVIGQAVGADNGVDASGSVGVSFDGYLGLSSADSNQDTFTINFDLSGLPGNFLLCHLGGLEATHTEKDSVQNSMHVTVAASVVINGTTYSLVAFPDESIGSTDSKYFAGLLPQISVNVAALYGRPLTNADTLSIELQTSRSEATPGKGYLYADVSALSASSIRCIGV